jgi:hypothetical protein
MNKGDFEDVKEGMKINYESAQQPKKDTVVSNALLMNQIRKVRAVQSIIKFEIEKNDVFELNNAGIPSALPSIL